MTHQAARLTGDLETAADTFHHPEVERLCEELTRRLQRRLTVPPEDAGKILQTLRRKRYYALAEQVGAAFIRAGVAEPEVWRQYAQALIEGKKLTAALAVLTRLAQSTPEDSMENVEARGLTGRVFKQHYVDTTQAAPHRDQALVQALVAYKSVFDGNPARRWHGINAVALACRAERDRVRLPFAVEPAAMSQVILAAIEAREKTKGRANAWDCATALEACVALRRWPEAIQWASRYVQRPGTDAFEIASTLRQLTEVWEIDPDSEDGGAIVLLLKAQLLRKHGGQVRFEPAQLASGRLQSLRDRLQARLGSEEILPLKQLLEGVERCRSIAKVTRAGGAGFGSGFVVSAKDLGHGEKDELFLLTNAHVISDDPKVHRQLSDRPPLWPQEARAWFEVDGSSFGVGEIVWSSPPTESGLDATLVRLTPPLTKREACPLNATLTRVAEAYRRVYVIGHPGGGELAFSLSDNLVLGFKAPRLHYRAPTEYGSSGSPVFTADWEVLALHHAGSQEMPRLEGRGSYPANEGIWIDAIKRGLARDKSRGRAPGNKRRSV
jgi:hypothetical protein